MTLVKVVGYEFLQMPYTKRGQGQNRLVLECGHKEGLGRSRKTSVPIPRRARCLECEEGKR